MSATPSLSPEHLRAEIEALRTRLDEMKQVQHVLRRNEAKTRLVLDSLPQRMLVRDRDGRCVWANRAFAESIGLSLAEILGRSGADLERSRDPEQARKADEAVVASGVARTELERGAGTEADRVFEVVRSPVRDARGRIVGVTSSWNDVTERRRAERTLRKSKQLLQGILNNSPALIHVKDVAGAYLLVNQQFESRMGVTQERILGATDAEIFPPKAAEAIRRNDARVLEAREPIEVEEVFPVGDEERVFLVLKFPMNDAAQAPYAICGIATEITDRKRAEQAFRESEARNAAILESALDCIVLMNPAGEIVEFNPAAVKTFGFRRDEVLGKDLAQTIFPTPSQEQYRGRMGSYIANSQGSMLGRHVETYAQRADGTVFPVEMAMTLVQVRGLPVMTLTLRDITERRQAEKALKDSEERYRDLFENANDIIFTYDLNGRFTSFNKAAERVTGYSRRSALKRSVVDLFAGETEDKLAEILQSSSEVRKAGRTLEARLVAKDGRKVAVELSPRLIMKEGRPVAVQSIARDITERKEAEAALQRQARLLSEQAEELERRNAELRKAYEELQDAEAQLIHSEKMAAIGQLVAGLAHEINNPTAFTLANLTNIDCDLVDIEIYMKACLEFEEAARSIAPEHAERLARVREEVQVAEAFAEVHGLLESTKGGLIRIRDLVANLRSYSRIDVRGQYALENLNEGLEATLTMLKPITKKGVEVELRLGEVPRVECNLGQINQVFMNLMANAIQAMKGDGQLSVVSEKADGGVLVRIRDTGPGIPASIRQRIFDPFFTTKDVGEGTGLGLSISRKIVDANSGRLEFDSAEGSGTEFRLWLPLRQVGEATTEPVTAASTSDPAVG